MKKTVLWAILAAAVVLIAIAFFVLPWLGTQVAAILVGAIGVVGGLFFSKKRTT